MRLGSSIRRRRRAGLRGGGAASDGAPSRWDLWKRLGDRRLLAAAGGLAVLGLLGGYFFSTRVLFPLPPPPGDMVRVPDLRGKTLEEAEDSLARIGLSVGPVDSFRHPLSPEGTIVGQSPLPGQLAVTGDSLLLALSLGPERRPVPDVLNLRADRAREVLEATGFQVVLDSVDSDLPRGALVAVSPEPGTEVVLPEEVTLRVSMGPPYVEMPLLLGMTEERALAVLDSLGLVVPRVETRFRFGRDQGLVVEQEPPARTMLPVGSAVRLVVGRRGR